MNKNAIIIDADGVLLDIYNYLTYTFKQDTGITFDFSREIKSWSMQELNHTLNSINLRRYIMSKFNNPEFIYNINMTKNSIEALEKIYAFYSDKNTDLIIYTSAMNEKCLKARTKWYIDTIQPTMPNIKFRCQIGQKPAYQDIDCTITAVIDDYIENLNKYDDTISKYLITQCHNRTENDIPKSIQRISNFDECCNILMT